MCSETGEYKKSMFGREGKRSSLIMNIFIQVIALITVTSGLPINETKTLPSYLQPCRQDNPQLNECIRQSINTLIRNIKSGSVVLGLPPVDPLQVPLVDLSVDSSNLTLQLFLKDVTIVGISETNILSVKASLDDYKFEVVSKTPLLQVQGMFSSEGGVLTFPLSSSGAFFVNMTDVTAIWILYYHEEPAKPGGLTHYQIDDFGLELLPSDIRLEFGHELDGDNALGEAMNAFLNGNSHEIFNDVKPRITKLLGHIFSDLGNRVFASFPAKILLPLE